MTDKQKKFKCKQDDRIELLENQVAELQHIVATLEQEIRLQQLSLNQMSGWAVNGGPTFG